MTGQSDPRLVLTGLAVDWNEGDHPRDDNGQFGEGSTQTETFYHGTSADLDGEIRPSASGLYGPGVYVTNRKGEAENWGGGTGAKIHAFKIGGKLADDDDFDTAIAAAKAKGFKHAEARAEAHKILAEAGFVGIHDGPVTVVFDPTSLTHHDEESDQ